MKHKEAISILIRYLLLLVFSFSNLYLFYLIFQPLTIYPVFWILKSIYGATLENTMIIFSEGGIIIDLIPACIAGAAYYLLLILNLTTPMKLNKRLRSMLFLFATFLILNIIRIVIFSVLLANGYSYFDLAHKITWYFTSTALVVLIWFSNVKLFKIKQIPVYTDFKIIYKKIRGKR